MNRKSVMIPLSQLHRSKDNVRHTGVDADIPMLAASIEAHGLLQNLGVRRRPEVRAGESQYEVVAGGRRLQALKLLVQRKKLAKDHRVACLIVGNDQTSGLEVSLAENVVRAALHPADQFDAFAQLHEDGLSSIDIAARFGVSDRLVEQRLKLAAVSPKLMLEYREARMTLEQLTAFAANDDHALQEHVWFEAPLFDRSAATIRRALTRTSVDGTDRRARFIGVEAYELAGGVVHRDLFNEQASYFTNSQLLDRLVEEKLAAAATVVSSEGWSFVEIRPELDYEALARFGRVVPQRVTLPTKDARRLKRLSDRYDQLVATIEDEVPDEQAETLDKLSAEIEALSRKQEHWGKKKLAEAGALVSLTSAGTIQVTRGLTRSQGRQEKAESVKPLQSGAAKSPTDAGISEGLSRELSAYRTAALRESLAGQVDLSLTALVHTLALKVFFGIEGDTSVEVRTSSLDLSALATDIGECAAMRAMTDRHAHWAQHFRKPEDVLQWLSGQSIDAKLSLLAYLTASTINGVILDKHYGDTPRLRHADELARAAVLDMAKWWRPTAANYFGRIRKDQIIEAVSEQLGPNASKNLVTLNRQAMAARAEQLLADTGWLPSLLRFKEPLSAAAE